MSNLHWEAVRRQKFVDRKHEAQLKMEEQRKELAEKNLQQRQEGMSTRGSRSASYQRQLLESQGQAGSACNHPSLDEQRRLEHQDVLKEHFHRTRLRYNDVDCAQQW